MYMDRIWIKHYPEGAPRDIGDLAYENLIELFEHSSKMHQEHIAFSCMGKDLSYGEVDRLSTKFACYLQYRGLKHGDKFAIMLPNILQYPIALIGALKAGLIIVNTNPLYTPTEIRHQLKDSDTKGIIIADNFAHQLEQVLTETDVQVVITTSIGEMLGFMKGSIVNFVIKKVKRLVPKYDIKNAVPFKEALKSGAKFKLLKPQVSRHDLAALQYTGGTTSASKGAMLTHSNILSNLEQMSCFWGNTLQEGKEVILTALPLYHIFGFTVNLLSTYRLGSQNVLIPNARDLSSLIKAFKKYPISLFSGVNTLFHALNNSKEFKTLDFESLKLVASGGMALQSTVAEAWEHITKVKITQGYGLTEASPAVCFNPLVGLNKSMTVGIAIPSTDIKIVDDKNNEVSPGHAGELCVAGPQIMRGYYKDQEETNKALINGWLHTGDVAQMDEDGYISIVDRIKDMIIVSGFNVYPNQIEDIVMSHGKVSEVAAVGISDEKSGEAVKLFVVKKDSSLKADELIQYCREHMTGYKVPKEVEFRKELPKTNVGKILKRALKAN